MLTLRIRLGVSLGALGLAANLAAPAVAAASPHEAAMRSCAAAGDEGPARPVTAIADGRGGSLVWLTDADTNLFLCSAGADGHVYAYSKIFDDLLAGEGAHLVEPLYVDGDGQPVTSPPDPLAVAERACQAYLAGEDGKVVGKVSGKGADGLNEAWLPGYFVFIESAAGETFLCDATANAQVWAFARIGKPLGSPLLKSANPTG
ncbi:MAG TPA: hypothetical protein VMW57_02545 [Methyloceanibacter sp.]|nr:hypothetical protein [Methyloceanibacter sp.]